MKAIILAAGQGTRLRPLTNNRPKCLVNLNGKPLLEHQLRTLRACGLDDIHVVGGYRAEQLCEYDITLHINLRYAETNMVTTLFAAEAEMTSESDIVIAYGDIVYEKRVLKALLESDAPISIVVDTEWRRYWSARMEDPLTDAETMKLSDENKVTELGKKPKNYKEIQGQYIGLIKIRADKLPHFLETWHAMDRGAKYDGKDFYNMYMTSFLQHMIDNGWSVHACLIENGWAEVDCERDLQIATQFFNIEF